MNRSMRLAMFLLRMLCLSAISLPVLADDAALFVPDLPSPTPAIGTRGPAIPHVTDLPSSPDAPQIAVPASTCQYWIASSRCSVQNIHEISRGAWGLQVYQRDTAGQLIGSDISALSSQLTPGVPVCILVHGSFVSWEDEVKEGHAAYCRLRGATNTPLQFIFFTWPSDGDRTGCFAIDVAVRGRQADFNGFHLSYLVSQIPPSCPICFVGHSHGSRVIFSSLHMAGGGSVEGHRFPYSMGPRRRYRVVLAAGAMDHNWLNPGQQFGCALSQTECVLNLQNRHDLPLALYPISRPFASRALARSGFTWWDKKRLGPQAGKLRDFDVTDQVGHKHLWPYYYNSPKVIGAMVPYVYFY